jgi:hypothetical protein
MSSPLIALSPSYHNKFNNHSAGSSSDSITVISSEQDAEFGNNPSANEIIRGPVKLVSASHSPQNVVLSVFRTSVDHFALVYPDNRGKLIAVKPAGCINLKGVTCEETTLGSDLKGFTLRPKKCDTSSATLTFMCEDPTLLPQWIKALEPASPVTALGQRRMPRQCSLPSVEEED